MPVDAQINPAKRDVESITKQVRLGLNHLIDELAQVHSTGEGRKQYWITELLCNLCIINSYLPHDHTWTHPIDINKDVLRMLSDKLGMDNVKTVCCLCAPAKISHLYVHYQR